MKNIEEFKKTMPFNESEEYIDNLWMKAADKAVSQQKEPARILSIRRHVFTAIATAAVVILIATVSWRYIGKQFFTESSQQVAVVSDTPLDDFLGSISDEEAAKIECYQVNAIEGYN